MFGIRCYGYFGFLSSVTFCRHKLNMPKRGILQDPISMTPRTSAAISPKAKQRATSTAVRPPEDMGRIFSRASNSSPPEHGDRYMVGTSRTTQVTEQGSDMCPIPQDETGSSNIKQSSEEVQSDVTKEEHTKPCGDVVNDLINTHASIKGDDITSPDDETQDSSKSHHITDSVSRETLDHSDLMGKSKPTVLPKQLLDNVTSLVSEKREGGEPWLQSLVADPPTTGDQMGNLVAEGRGKARGKGFTGQTFSEEGSKKVKKERPNFFVSVQITNPEIHWGLAQVQLAVLASNSRMTEVMIKLPTLHLTVMVMNLKNEEDIERASEALDECGSTLRDRFKEALPVLEVDGIGTFRNQVVFAKVIPGDALNQLMYIHDCVKETMAKHGVMPTDASRLTPHITIMKMSKVKTSDFRRTVARRIEPELYKEFKERNFGSETVRRLQLCFMDNPKDAFGYYRVAHQVYLGQGEVTVSEFSQNLVQSALVSSMETMKQNSCQEHPTQDNTGKDAKKKPKSARYKKPNPMSERSTRKW